MIFDVSSLERTTRLGERLGAALAPGDFVGLSGDLGSGKTALVRAIAAGAGVASGTVTSPTFSLINTYPAPRFPIHHADLYRLSSRDELYATGYFDLLDGEGALLVEWVERIPGAAPRSWLEGRFDLGEEGRSLTLAAHGARAEALLELLLDS
jgi:tRNA threonylcarbamoyladenosine biosynthesis protein TsaE